MVSYVESTFIWLYFVIGWEQKRFIPFSIKHLLFFSKLKAMQIIWTSSEPKALWCYKQLLPLDINSGFYTLYSVLSYPSRNLLNTFCAIANQSMFWINVYKNVFGMGQMTLCFIVFIHKQVKCSYRYKASLYSHSACERRKWVWQRVCAWWPVMDWCPIKRRFSPHILWMPWQASANCYLQQDKACTEKQKIHWLVSCLIF